MAGAIFQKISKQNILDFVISHPKLITLLAGIGITITFSLVSRFSIEHTQLAFAQDTGGGGSFPVDKFPSDTVADKFPVEKVPKTLNQIPNVTCPACIDESFPPGLKK